MNANYVIPESDKTFQDFHHLIKSMLKVNPTDRPNAEDVYAELVSIGTDRNVDLRAPILESAVVSPSGNEADTAVISGGGGAGPQQGSSVLLGSVVSKAGSLFSNIKDVSSKVCTH